jgi:23S rRNA pseudouridine2605 synthase
MMERLQKLLSMAGVASRRASEELITQGRVEVNGEIVRALGSKADPVTDTIKVDGRRLRFDVRARYIVLNKPKGVVTTRKDPERRRTVIELLKGVREYVYPVGRLDYESEGLLLLTSDGDLAAKLTHPRHEVERVYEAIVVGAPEDADLEKLRRGIVLDGARTAPAQVRRAGTIKQGRQQLTRLTVTLHEGRNRQVRRMCASIGHPVRKLTRTRMGPITLGDLRPGQWRDLTEREVRLLREAASPRSPVAPSE